MIIRAFMPVLNEVDVLPWSLTHLHTQGVTSIHIIDGWSTDGSWENVIGRFAILSGFSGAITAERFPVEGDSHEQTCTAILKRIEDLAAESEFDWCMINDADEIRRSSRPGETLAEGIARLDAQGYNAIDHKAYAFFPTDDGYTGDPEAYLRYFGDDMICHIPQQKLWKNIGRVDLSTHGGHIVQFPGKRVAPEKFVMKHYPFRTNAQAGEKIRTRLERRCQEEHRAGWGVHYDAIRQTSNFIRDPASLTFWRDTEHPTP
jgi:hypothetical protein